MRYFCLHIYVKKYIKMQKHDYINNISRQEGGRLLCIQVTDNKACEEQGGVRNRDKKKRESERESERMED